jgi:hypothetical protein
MAKVREMNEAARFAIRQAQISLDENVTMRETIIGKIVEHAGGQVIAQLQPWLIVRETALR